MSVPEGAVISTTSLEAPTTSLIRNSRTTSSKAQEASRQSSATSSPASLRSFGTIESHDDMMQPNETISGADSLPPPAYSAAAPPTPFSSTMGNQNEMHPGHYSGNHNSSLQQYGSTPQHYPNTQPVMSESSHPRTSAPANLESAPLLVRRRPPKRPSRCGRCCSGTGGCCNIRCIIQCILIVSLIVVLCLLLARALIWKSRNNSPPGSGHKGNDHGNMTYPDPFDDFQPKPQCNFPVQFDNRTINFERLNDFVLLECMKTKLPTNPRHDLSGRLSIQTAKFDQESAVMIFVSSGAANTNVLKLIQYSITKSGFEIDTSQLYDMSEYEVEDKRNRPCIFVNIILSVKPNASFGALSVDTVHLDIEIDKNFGVNSNTTSLKTVVGDVTGIGEDRFRSQRIVVQSVAGSVEGSWPLRDLLSVSTVAGNIDVNVLPKEASSSSLSASAAEFRAASEAGDIKVRFPQTGYIPNRNYITEASAAVGDLSGHFIHGISTNFSSAAGDIDVNLLPYAADDYKSVLSTASASGDTAIMLLSPYKDPGKPIKRFDSLHMSFDGDLEINYAKEWEGTIDATSFSGSKSVTGKDVEIIEKTSTEIKAKKGNGDGRMQLENFSGTIDVTIGNS